MSHDHAKEIRVNEGADVNANYPGFQRTPTTRQISIAVPNGISGDELAFLEEVLEEVVRSREFFPAPDCNGHALQEEAGEVSKALMYEPWANVRKECVQLANMALRLTLEGDVTMVDFRAEKGNVDMPVQQIVKITPTSLR